MPVALGTVASHRTATAVAGLPVAGAVGWWDAADPASITASGGAVSQLADKSGGNRHLTQTTAGAKPVTGTATRNGKNVIVFDGGDHLAYAGNTNLNVGDVTVFLVLAETVANDYCGFFVAWALGGNDSSDAGSFAINGSVSGYTMVVERVGAGGNIPSAGGPAPWGVYSVTLAADGTTALWQDGAAGVGGTVTATFRVADGGYVLGARQFGGVGTYPMNGQFGEGIVYDRVLSTGERQTMQSHLRTGWGTP